MVKIWDTCGQERFRSLTANYYRNADGIILVFDANDQSTFEGLKNWIISINDNVEISIPKVVICNKADLERKVNNTIAKQFAKEHKVEIFESSAKTNMNVQEPFNYIIKEVLKTKRQKEKKLIQEQPFPEHNQCQC